MTCGLDGEISSLGVDAGQWALESVPSEVLHVGVAWSPHLLDKGMDIVALQDVAGQDGMQDEGDNASNGVPGGEGELGSHAQPGQCTVLNVSAGQQAGSPVRDDGDTQAKSHCDGHDEADSSGHWDGGDDLQDRDRRHDSQYRA